MLKHLTIGLLAAGVMSAGATPVMAKAHTEAVAAACMERPHFSEAECACIAERAADLSAGEVAYMLSLNNGEPDNLDVARENEIGLRGMAAVHWFLRTDMPICKITE